jgi:hypothetical protein
MVLPVDEGSSKVGVRAKAEARFTTFQTKGISGSYTEWFLSSEYRGLKHWVFGAQIPLVLLRADRETHFGLGNSIVYGEWRAFWNQKGSFGIGLQAELPWGSGHGMSDDHWVLLPNVNVHIPFWRLFVMANVGYSQSVNGHDHSSHGESEETDGVHDHSVQDSAPEFVFVGIHAQGELVYRLTLGLPLFDSRFQPMLTVNGQQVVVGEGEKTFVQAGVSLIGRVNDIWAIQWGGEVPISTAKRYNGRMNLAVTADF